MAVGRARSCGSASTGMRMRRPSSVASVTARARGRSRRATPVSPFISSSSWSFRVWTTRSPTRNGVPGIGSPVGVQPRAQLGVERLDARPGRGASARAPGCRAPGRGRSGAGRRSAASETASANSVAGGRARERGRSRAGRPRPASVGGGSPWLIAWAARTISERRAWRKISVRRDGGHGAPLEQVVEHAARRRPAGAGRRRRRAARACAGRPRGTARRRGAATASRPRRRPAGRRRGSGRPRRA